MAEPGARVDGAPIILLETVDSTNAEALRRIAAGERGPLWLRAERQTAGRGRSGRQWESLPGNLFASLILTPNCGPETGSQLAFVSGVALHDAVCSMLPSISAAALELKWPNDLLLQGAKLGGILIERLWPTGCDAATLVIGFGLNLARHPPLESGGATNLSAHGAELSAALALTMLAQTVTQWTERWAMGDDFATVRRAWLDRAHAEGRPISVRLGGEVTEGFFAGIDASGALRLRTGCTERRITAGDVFFR